MLVTNLKRKRVVYRNSDFLSLGRSEIDIIRYSLVGIVYKCTVFVLIIHNMELCVDIARKSALVMVEMLLVNICENRNLGRGACKFKLVRGHFNNRIGVGRNAFKRLKNRHADISDKPCVLARRFEHFVCERRGCGLAL